MKLSGSGLMFVGGFLVTASMSLGVICLFRFFLSNLVLENCIFLGIYTFHPDFPICWHIIIYNILFTIICLFLVLVVMSPLSFLILFILVISLFFLMSLVKAFPILFIFLKNQLLDSLKVCIFFYSILFIYALIFIISFLLLTLDFVVLFLVHLSVKLDSLFEISLVF